MIKKSQVLEFFLGPRGSPEPYHKYSFFAINTESPTFAGIILKKNDPIIQKGRYRRTAR